MDPGPFSGLEELADGVLRSPAPSGFFQTTLQHILSPFMVTQVAWVPAMTRWPQVQLSYSSLPQFAPPLPGSESEEFQRSVELAATMSLDEGTVSGQYEHTITPFLRYVLMFESGVRMRDSSLNGEICYSMETGTATVSHNSAEASLALSYFRGVTDAVDIGCSVTLYGDQDQERKQTQKLDPLKPIAKPPKQHESHSVGWKVGTRWSGLGCQTTLSVDNDREISATVGRQLSYNANMIMLAGSLTFDATSPKGETTTPMLDRFAAEAGVIIQPQGMPGIVRATINDKRECKVMAAVMLGPLQVAFGGGMLGGFPFGGLQVQAQL